MMRLRYPAVVDMAYSASAPMCVLRMKRVPFATEPPPSRHGGAIQPTPNQSPNQHPTNHRTNNEPIPNQHPINHPTATDHPRPPTTRRPLPTTHRSPSTVHGPLPTHDYFYIYRYFYTQEVDEYAYYELITQVGPHKPPPTNHPPLTTNHPPSSPPPPPPPPNDQPRQRAKSQTDGWARRGESKTSTSRNSSIASNPRRAG